jgi:hypothetical protein
MQMQETLIPTSELETALVALLFALKDYNRALTTVGRDGNRLVSELTQLLEGELDERPQTEMEAHRLAHA